MIDLSAAVCTQKLKLLDGGEGSRHEVSKSGVEQPHDPNGRAGLEIGIGCAYGTSTIRVELRLLESDGRGVVKPQGGRVWAKHVWCRGCVAVRLGSRRIEVSRGTAVCRGRG